jgi:hypothetical protein
MARVVYLLVALALLGGAVVAFVAAGLVNLLACENEGTPACTRQDLAFGQFILAVIGLVLALVLLVAAALRKKAAGRARAGGRRAALPRLGRSARCGRSRMG